MPGLHWAASITPVGTSATTLVQLTVRCWKRRFGRRPILRVGNLFGLLQIADRFFARRFRISIWEFAAIPFWVVHHLSLLDEPLNYYRDRNSDRRVSACHKIVCHDSQSAFIRLHSTRRIWLNYVEKPEEQERNDHHDRR